MATFTHLSSIVDDVNNQTLLRHTQLFIEGTSKVRYNIIANVVDNLESLLIVTFMFFFHKQLRGVVRNCAIFGNISHGHYHDQYKISELYQGIVMGSGHPVS